MLTFIDSAVLCYAYAVYVILCAIALRRKRIDNHRIGLRSPLWLEFAAYVLLLYVFVCDIYMGFRAMTHKQPIE